MTMDVGIHLPQFGPASGPDAIRSAAVRAEQLGFAGVWVSDHIVQPADQGYPSPYLYDPMLTLTWAAAATESIGLGTSVLVAPQYHALWLANALASLDNLSGGRLTVAIGVGWSEAEFDALDQSFADRGARTDEIIRVLRACWSQDPVTFRGEFFSFDDIRVLPKPAHEIPIWVGGQAPAALRRAAGLGDGYHCISATPEEIAPIVAGVRAERPESDFVISHRTGWDPQGMDPDLIRAERDGYEAVGVQYVVAAPWQRTLDEWLRSMELLAEVVGLGTDATVAPTDR